MRRRLNLAADLRHAWRRLRHAPAAAALGVLTLALGIGATTTIFSLAHAIWLRPLPYADPGALVSIHDVHPASGTTASVSPPEIEDYRTGATAFSGVAGFAYGAGVVRLNGDPVRIIAFHVTPDLFRVLGVSPAAGRDFLPADVAGESKVAILSHAFWRRRFAGDPNVVGTPMFLSDAGYTIVGVMPEGFRFPEVMESDVWIPSHLSRDLDRSFRFTQAIARLRPGIGIADASRDVARVAARLGTEFPATNAGWTARVESVSERSASAYRGAFVALLGLVGIFQAIACVNLASLLLARNTARRSALVICLSLGASRWRLTRQLLLESLIQSAAGCGLGVIAAGLGGRALRTVLPAYTPRLQEVGIDTTVLAFAIGVSLVTAVLCSLAPAAGLRSLSAGDALVGTRVGPRSHRTHSALVVVEVALALLLTVGAGLMVRSFGALIARDRGFNPHGVLTLGVSLPFSGQAYADMRTRTAAFDDMLSRIAGLPGVTSAGATTGFPGSAQGILGAVPLATHAAGQVMAIVHAASPDYFKAMQVPLYAGRTFEPRDGRSSALVVIVNRTLAARLWPDGDAIGRRLPLPSISGMTEAQSVEVVGVVGDVRMGTRATPDLFLALSQVAPFWIDMIVRTDGRPERQFPRIRETLRTMNRDLLVEHVSSLDGIISDTYGLQRAQSWLAALVAVLSATLSALGLYGLLSYSVAQRTRELGLRLALGSQPARLFRWVFARGLALAGGGIGIGLLAAVLAVRGLRTQIFGLSAPDVMTFVWSAAALLCVSAVGLWRPARRVLRLDPLAAIRED